MKFSTRFWFGSLISVFLFIGCTGNQEVSAPVATPGSEADLIDSTLPTVGVMNFRQLQGMLYTNLELQFPNEDMSEYYTDNKGSFSSDGSVTGISSSMLLKTTEFVSIACRAFVRREGGDNPATTVFAGVDFNRGAADVSPAVRRSVTTELARRFWKRDPTEAELAEVSQMLNSFTGEVDIFLIAACTSVGASLDSIINL